jgi:ribosomal protein L17
MKPEIRIRKIARKTNLRFRCYALCTNERLMLNQLNDVMMKSLLILKYKTNLDINQKQKLKNLISKLFKKHIILTTVPKSAEEVRRPLRWLITIDSFDVDQYWNYFETTRKEDLHLLMKALRIIPDEYVVLENGSSMTGVEIMLRGLYELVSGADQNEIAAVFGRDFTQQSRAMILHNNLY